MPPDSTKTIAAVPVQRIRLWYALLLLIMSVFVVRLFYLQIIQHDYYHKAALSDQLKEYQIPAERGIIKAHDGDNVLPIVLNETRYTLFADPKYVQDPHAAAAAVQKIIGGQASDYEKAMRADTRYAVLAKKLTKNKKDQLDALNLKGIGTRDESVRTYPQGDLAAQLLGFVNDDGDGKYGVEQYYNDQLKGKPGRLKAITDASGVPLVANKNNVEIEPQSGQQLVLTVDISMQRQLQDILKAGLDAAKSSSGSALILDANTGAVKAMANYPSYNPAEFYKVSDASVFNNATVSAPLEVGSVMKTLTSAAALNQGVVTTNTTYFDPSFVVVDGFKITNIEEDGGPGTRNLADILQLSLNTGAVWLLKQMGGGDINQKARLAWHDYMVNHFRLSEPTGIEQGYEAAGSIPDPNHGYGLDLQYANSAFGQGVAITPLQLGAALASVVNGGTYYQPHLIDQTVDSHGKVTLKQPVVENAHVVSPQVSNQLQSLMEYVISKNYVTYSMTKPRPQYSVGGKTGTAEIAKPGGGYYTDRYNGMFVGFVGGDKPQYVIVVRVNEPHINGYAGSKAAAPIFGHLVDMLINNFNVTPKGS